MVRIAAFIGAAAGMLLTNWPLFLAASYLWFVACLAAYTIVEKEVYDLMVRKYDESRNEGNAEMGGGNGSQVDS